MATLTQGAHACRVVEVESGFFELAAGVWVVVGDRGVGSAAQYADRVAVENYEPGGAVAVASHKD